MRSHHDLYDLADTQCRSYNDSYALGGKCCPRAMIYMVSLTRSMPIQRSIFFCWQVVPSYNDLICFSWQVVLVVRSYSGTYALPTSGAMVSWFIWFDCHALHSYNNSYTLVSNWCRRAMLHMLSRARKKAEKHHGKTSKHNGEHKANQWENTYTTDSVVICESSRR